MRPFINRGFPPRFTLEEKLLIARYLGCALWGGVVVSLTILAVFWPRLSEIPGLASRVLVGVGGLSLLEAIVGYLLYAGIVLA